MGEGTSVGDTAGSVGVTVAEIEDTGVALGVLVGINDFLNTPIAFPGIICIRFAKIVPLPEGSPTAAIL